MVEAATEPESENGANPSVKPSKKRRRRANRADKRERKVAEFVTNPEPGGYAQTKFVGPSVPLKVDTDFKEARAASTGYTGLDDKIRARTDILLKDVPRKFRVQKWDGRWVLAFIHISERQ